MSRKVNCPVLERLGWRASIVAFETVRSCLSLLYLGCDVMDDADLLLK
jgi:hypothetical protein